VSKRREPGDDYWYFFLPALFILLIMALFPLWRAWNALQYPYSLDYAEGYLAVEAWQITHGQNIYPDLKDYPFLVSNYPPIFPLLTALIFFFSGPTLFWGRLICCLSALGILFLTMLVILKKTGQLMPAILAPLLIVNTYEFYEWIAYARVDLPAIFFGLAGLVILSDEDADLNWRLQKWAIVFFLFSIYTKQIQIFAPLAACIYLFFRDKKSGLRFALTFIGSALFLFIMLSLVTGGQYFKHTVIYNANRYDWWQVWVWFRHLLRFYIFYIIILFLLTVIIVCRTFINKGEKKKIEPGLFSIYAIIGALSFLTIGKVGAAGNYILEAHVALAIFFGLSISKVAELLNNSPHRRFAWVMLFLIAILVNLHAGYLAQKSRLLFSRPNPGKGAYAKNNMLFDIIKSYPDPVLCEQPLFLLRAGKKVLFQPFIMSELSREGKWNQGKFVDDLRRRKFSLIVTGQDMFREGFLWQYTDEMRRAIRENYITYPEPLQTPSWASLSAIMRSAEDGIPYYLYVPKREVK